jgi:aldose 1-epimerase
MTINVRLALVVLAVSGLAAACAREGSSAAVQQPDSAKLTQTLFDRLPDGTRVDVITLRNDAGVEVRIMTYGATVLSIRTPDRTGAIDDIVLGFDKVEPYTGRSPYMGAIVGRYGNRIAKGLFSLDGATYTLAKNNGPNHLHGGVVGFDKRLWTSEPFSNAETVGTKLSYTSPDGEEGYPGTLRADVTYTLTDKSELIVDYHATTDKPTVVNLTHHSYFNLGGAKTSDILGTELTINADRYTPVDAGLIPTGVLAPVEGTPFDFRTPTAIGARIDQNDPQLKMGNGYDHNWVLNRQGDGLALAARATDPVTGRTLDVETTEPGLQFYTGNFLDGTLTGKAGRVYARRSGFCLETQHYPDSPNHPSFPSTVLRPGQEYRSQTVFKFGAK